MSTLSKPYTFTAGTYAVASQVNANLDTIYSWINSNAIWADASIAFTAVPVGPNSDPVAPNHLTRKAYVDAQFPHGKVGYYSVVDTTGIPVIVQPGLNMAVTADVGGNFIHTFPTAFPTGLLSVVAVIAESDQNDLMVQLSTNFTATATQFGGRVVHSATSGPTGFSGTTHINYVAIGY